MNEILTLTFYISSQKNKSFQRHQVLILMCRLVLFRIVHTYVLGCTCVRVRIVFKGLRVLVGRSGVASVWGRERLCHIRCIPATPQRSSAIAVFAHFYISLLVVQMRLVLCCSKWLARGHRSRDNRLSPSCAG